MNEEIDIKIRETFDVNAISEMLIVNDFLLMVMRRDDRKKVDIYFRTYNVGVEQQVNITADAKHMDNQGYLATGKIPSIHCTERVDSIAKFIIEVQNSLNLYQECKHCYQPFKRGYNGMCLACAAYGLSLLREECIVCKTSDHATMFKCHKCIDSNVCLQCTNNELFKNVCPICKTSQQVFGCKRKHCDHNNEDDNEDDDS